MLVPPQLRKNEEIRDFSKIKSFPHLLHVREFPKYFFRILSPYTNCKNNIKSIDFYFIYLRLYAASTAMVISGSENQKSTR